MGTNQEKLVVVLAAKKSLSDLFRGNPTVEAVQYWHEVNLCLVNIECCLEDDICEEQEEVARWKRKSTAAPVRSGST